MEDSKPQPFSQFILVDYFLQEFNSTHQEDMSEEEHQKCALEIALTVKNLMSMTTGEIKAYFAEVDRRRIEATEKANDRTIFEFCLIREISQLKCSGAERESLRTSRIEAYEAGEFDYSIDAKKK